MHPPSDQTGEPLSPSVAMIAEQLRQVAASQPWQKPLLLPLDEDSLATIHPIVAQLYASFSAQLAQQQAQLDEARQGQQQAERKWLAAEEKLRELYITSTRTREESASQLQELENLLAGLQVLTETLDSAEALRQLLDVLQRVLAFEHAFVLTASGEGEMEALVTTHTAFANTRWRPQAFFNRVLLGKSLAVFDIAQLPEWQMQPTVRETGAVSALHIPLTSRKQRAILICTHSQRGFFTRPHILLAERFASLASQALQNAELYLALKQERDILDARVAERTEELARARDTALEASRLKSELLANVSHELRTPLNAILGYAEILREGLHGSQTSRQRGMTERIIANSETLLIRINDLLDSAQMEAGTLQLHATFFPANSLLEHVLATMSILAQQKNLSLVSEIDADVPRSLWGDEQRLYQIIVNLVTNAIKFTQVGGVRVRLYRPDQSHWAIAVSDSGLGIPYEAQQYIFEPFRQVDSSATREQGGSGLGLAIVKQLVELMEGKIELDSRPGAGSTFTVLLPLKPDLEGRSQ